MPRIQSLLPVILLGLSVSVGLYLGYQFLQRRRNRPALIALHILPGLAALEVIAMLLRGTPGGVSASSSTVIKASALLLVIGLIVGLLTPMVARDRPRTVATVALGVHALLAATAFGLLLVWLA
ncbi:MAG: hypothetical protein R3E65_11770 [Steroidobacteraceae bacterium]